MSEGEALIFFFQRVVRKRVWAVRGIHVSLAFVWKLLKKRPAPSREKLKGMDPSKASSHAYYQLPPRSVIRLNGGAGPLYISLNFFEGGCTAGEAYGSSQARGLIGGAAAGLCHSHSNARSEPHL